MLPYKAVNIFIRWIIYEGACRGWWERRDGLEDVRNFNQSSEDKNHRSTCNKILWCLEKCRSGRRRESINVSGANSNAFLSSPLSARGAPKRNATPSALGGLLGLFRRNLDLLSTWHSLNYGDCLRRNTM